MIRFITLSLLAGMLCVGAGNAEGPKPFPDFKAKRVKPPKSGSTSRITIQIDPAAQIAPSTVVAAAPSDAVTSPRPGQYDWFWDKVSPAAASAGPGRLQSAITVLAAAQSKVPAPRLQHMQDIARANGIDILRSTIGTQVSRHWFWQ